MGVQACAFSKINGPKLRPKPGEIIKRTYNIEKKTIVKCRPPQPDRKALGTSCLHVLAFRKAGKLQSNKNGIKSSGRSQTV